MARLEVVAARLEGVAGGRTDVDDGDALRAGAAWGRVVVVVGPLGARRHLLVLAVHPALQQV